MTDVLTIIAFIGLSIFIQRYFTASNILLNYIFRLAFALILVYMFASDITFYDWQNNHMVIILTQPITFFLAIAILVGAIMDSVRVMVSILRS